ncbi:MAG: hypothetical protein A2V77_07865 [Anaeromyxobacter sp. RBG_16_69_14]|nr:MAG: hypothetical protein A2V77_07865 [Anaeromyxobacter sp. RBG_16_69_14]
MPFAADANPREAGADLAAAYGKLPLAFQENLGQADPRVRFTARGLGMDVFLTETAGILALAGDRPEGLRSLRAGGTRAGSRPVRRESAVVRMRLVGGAAAARPVGLEALPGTANYFLGDDPSRWRTDVPTYAKVKFPDVYPGVDLVFHGKQRQLEYDFVVAPGADPGSIRVAFDGADQLRVNEDGDLVLTIAGRELVQRRPLAYEEDGGVRRPLTSGARREVGASYVIVGKGEVAFRVSKRDPARRLVIDPVLAYSTYLGGAFNDEVWGIAVDRWGNALVAGETLSTDFPEVNPVQSSHGGGTYDAFVAKLDAAGGALVYATYLGGSAEDGAAGIAVDHAGNAYVTGNTASVDFPIANPFQSAYGGAVDAFVAKLDPRGTALVYATYLGGSAGDGAVGIAVDRSGNAYVTGGTGSTDFPTANPFQPAGRGGGDAFAAKLDPRGTALTYSTYLGGSGGDVGSAIAVDRWGRAHVTGNTSSDDFPTVNALQPARGSKSWEADAFVALLGRDGRALHYSTYLGGSGFEEGTGIAVDPLCGAYVTGNTWSVDFPTANPLQPASGEGGGDAFVARLACWGDRLVYSTYLGGSAEDSGNGIAVDGWGDAHVTGFTYSTDFPTADPLQPATRGNGDAFVARIKPRGDAFAYSTYLGGSSFDAANAIAVDTRGNAYVAGVTLSTDFPTEGPLQASAAGAADAFVAKVSPAASASPLSLHEAAGDD